MISGIDSFFLKNENGDFELKLFIVFIYS